MNRTLQESLRTLKQRAGERRASVARATVIFLVFTVMSVAPSIGCSPAESGAHAATGQQTGANPSDNSAPFILSVTPSTQRLQPGDVCRLACEARDDDGDPLTYAWTASQGDIVGEGSVVEWTAPEAEGLYRVAVEVADGRNGVDESSISIRVRNNVAPQFQSISVPEEAVRPGAAVEVSCSVTDSDGDEISYEWQAGHGAVQGEGASAVWIAPEKPGSYVITVLARDSFGAETRRDVLINVMPGSTPRLGEFGVEPVDHELLKFEAGAWDTYLGSTYRIECVVLEGELPFAYAWTADAGTLTVDGAVAIWVAPEERGPATVTVAVTDGRGDTNTGRVLMFVEDCTCVFK